MLSTCDSYMLTGSNKSCVVLQFLHGDEEYGPVFNQTFLQEVLKLQHYITEEVRVF